MCLAYEVHEAEAGFASGPADYAKVEPLGAAFGVHVVLHVEVVGGKTLFRGGKSKKQIPAFEGAVKGKPVCP